MAISFECGNCHQVYKVDEQRGGQSVKCKKCGAAVQIPAASGSPAVASTSSCPMCLSVVSALDTACPQCGAGLSGSASAPTLLPPGNWHAPSATGPKKAKKSPPPRRSNPLAFLAQQWVINLFCLAAIAGIVGSLGLYGYRAYQRSEAEYDRKLALQYKNRNMVQWLETARTGSTKHLSTPFEWREAATRVPVDPGALPELFKALDEGREAGRFAETALARFDGEACQEFKPNLVPLLSSPNPLVRTQALVLLGKLGTAAQDLIGSFPDERDPQVRRQMIATLANIGGDAAVRKLKELVSDVTDPLFGETLAALGRANGKEAVSIIDRILGQAGNAQAHSLAIAALPHCGAAGVPRLCTLVREAKPESANYTAALQALGSFDTSAADAAAELVKLLSSTDEAIRAQAGLALGSMVAQKPSLSATSDQLAALAVDQSQILPREIDSRLTSMNDDQFSGGSNEGNHANDLRIQQRVFVLQWAAEQLGKRRDPSVRPSVESALGTLRRKVEVMRKHELMTVGNVQVGKLEGDRVTYQDTSARTETVIIDADKFRAEERATALEGRRNAFRTYFSQLEGLCDLFQKAML